MVGFIMVAMRREKHSRRTRCHFPDSLVGISNQTDARGGRLWCWCVVVERGGRREGDNDDDDSRTKMCIDLKLFCIHCHSKAAKSLAIIYEASAQTNSFATQPQKREPQPGLTRTRRPA